MEYTLRRTQEIALTIFNLLDGDYDCTKLCINALKDIEMNEARDYHKEIHKTKKHLLFASYSFLYTLKANPWRNEQQTKMDNAKMIYNLPAELSSIGLYRDSNGIYRGKNTNMIDKYNELLDLPNLTTKQRDIILRMKENRKTNIDKI